LRLKSSIRIHTDMIPHPAKSSAAGILAALLLSACGSGGVSDSRCCQPPPPGSYDLHAAMAALVESGLSTNVKLSGTAIVNGTSNTFTGTGTLTLSPGVSGMFNGMMAQLQTQSISGTVTVAGQTSPYSSSAVNAYEPATTAIVGESQSTEFDVAQQPIVIPTVVGTSVTMLGTLSRYSDSTLSVALGTVQVSVAVMLIPVDPGSSEVVQFTYKVFDTSQALVETDTISYVLTENNQLSFYSAATQSASGTLTVMPQLAQ
jgi:type III secretory pathway component EscS